MHRPTAIHAASVAALACLALAAAPAGAQAVTLSGTNVSTVPPTTPARVDASTTSVIYYLDLHAGAADERFSVRLTPGRFATLGRADEGASVDGPLQFALSGPGTIGKVVTEPTFGELCSTRDRAFHGYATGAATVDVHLPAGASTTLAVRYAVGRRAPWVDTDLRLQFAFASALVGEYDPTSPLFGGPTAIGPAPVLTATQQIPAVATGKRKIGAHLLLDATPAGTYGEDRGAARKIAARTAVRVRGRLQPATAGKRVNLQWARPGQALRTAARVTTSKSGQFSTTLRPPGKGQWELWASYPTQSGRLAADSTSCPLRYSVR
ncbi:MAG: hypothetical protein JHD16_02495 [Solirubrobacteraceae bacterium]|nr:hypothetical protein [Solirubrobacteraceae bacterium]